MVEYVTTLINRSKQDGMLATLEASARLTSFNWALKVVLPPLVPHRVFLHLFICFASDTRDRDVMIPAPLIHGCYYMSLYEVPRNK